MTEQLEDGIKQVKNIIRMENYDLTEAGARLLVTIEQLIENLEYVNKLVIVGASSGMEVLIILCNFCMTEFKVKNEIIWPGFSPPTSTSKLIYHF